MSKVDKEFKRREQIAEATLAAREAVKNFDKLCENYTAWADDMARDGDVEGSNDMLLEKAEILEFRDGFVAIEKEIIRANTISEAFSNVEEIVKAITNCRKAFAKVPNLEKLADKLLATRKDIDKARESIPRTKKCVVCLVIRTLWIAKFNKGSKRKKKLEICV